MDLQAEDIDTRIGVREPLWYLPLQFVRTRDSPLHGVLLQFLEDGTTFVANQTTDEDGITAANWTCECSAIALHTIMVKVAEGQSTADCTIATQPLTLTVSGETRLQVWLERSYSGVGHVINGRLVDASDYSPLAGKTIKLDINGTVYELETNGIGYISLPKNFQPVNGTTTTYQISASFEGTNPQTANINATTPYGEEYAVCTTLQYDLKPSCNSTVVFVEPQSSSGEVTVKTQEEMQESASASGWLQIWPELTWWYPWFRIHIQVDVNPRIHVAFSPILPGGETAEWDGIEIFETLVGELIQDIIIDVVGIFVGYLAAKVLSIWNPLVGIIAEAIKGVSQFLLLVVFNWDNKLELLASAVVSFFMAFIALSVNIGKVFLQALLKLTSVSASSALLSLHFNLLHVLFVAQFTSRWWIDYVEMVIDWVIGGVALVRYLTIR